jgi:hypothetical protein
MKQRRAMTILSGLLCLFAYCTSAAAAAETASWSRVAGEIVAHIDNAESLYREGKPTEAGQAVTQAYFGVFEDRKMEAAMRIELGAKHTYQVEKQFGALRKAIRRDADRETIQQLAQNIRESVVNDARALDEAKISMEVFEIKP